MQTHNPQPPQTPPSPSNSLPANELQLTPGEAEALAGFDLDGNPIDAPATPPSPVEPPAAAAPPAAPAAAVEPPAAPAPANQLDGIPAHGPIGFNVAAPAARDYNAELLDAQRRNEAGTLEDEDFETLRADLIAQRAKAEAMAELSESFAQQNWENSCAAFLQLPQNAILLRDPDKMVMFDAMTQAVVNERHLAGHPPLPVWDLLRAAGDRLYRNLGLSAAPTAPAAPAAPAAPVPPNRNPDLSNIPPTLGAAPAAAGASGLIDNSVEGILSSNDLATLEQRMAGMSDDAVDALLSQTAGAFVDD